MLSGAIRTLGKSGYGILYIIPATFLYLLSTQTSVDILILDELLKDQYLIAFLILSLYGAMWVHQFGLLIFGDDAGLSSSKDSKVMRKSLIHFAFGVLPDQLPDSESFLDLIPAAIESGNLKWIVFLRFLPVAFFPVYQYVAWILLSAVLYTDPENLIGGAIWIVLTMFTFRKLVTGYMPSYIPEESAGRLDKPDYLRVREIVKETRRENSQSPRIGASRRTTPSNRYERSQGDE